MADVRRTFPDLFLRIVVVGFAYFLAARFGIHLSVRHEQQRGPSTDLVQGTGLGLSIVRGLANAGGGSVTYRHEDGLTTFAVTMLAWSSEQSGDRERATTAG